MGHKDTSQISRYERGTRTPSLETALEIAVAYEAPVERLFGGLLEELQKPVEKRKKRLKVALKGEDDETEEEVSQTSLN